MADLILFSKLYLFYYAFLVVNRPEIYIVNVIAPEYLGYIFEVFNPNT